MKKGDRVIHVDTHKHGKIIAVHPGLEVAIVTWDGEAGCTVSSFGNLEHECDGSCDLPKVTLVRDGDEDLKVGRRGVKAPLHDLPLWALHGVARVFSYGSAKYAPGNWIRAAKDKEMALQDYWSATLRHMGAVQEHGWASVDEESGLPHVYHALCSLIMLVGIGQKAEILPRDPGQGRRP